MKWFGESWQAPCCRDMDHLVPTPQGTCQGCGMPVEQTDRGVAIPHISLESTRKGGSVMAVEDTLYHQTCLLHNFGVQTVHILHEGLAYCGQAGVPGTWPRGHVWVPFDEWRQASCPACRTQGPVRYPADKEAAGLVATLGWDWAEFKNRIAKTPGDVLVGVQTILEEHPRPGEPARIQERSDLGLRMIANEIERRLSALSPKTGYG